MGVSLVGHRTVLRKLIVPQSNSGCERSTTAAQDRFLSLTAKST